MATATGVQAHACFPQLETALKDAESNLVKWRRTIHENPELGYQENDTSALIQSVLNGLGFEVHTGIAKTGVVGILRGQSERPIVGLRADIDALPIKEATGLPFASVKQFQLPSGDTVPVMHACGHDAHTAILLATAEAMAKVKNDLKGTLMVIFQPSEEGNTDAPKIFGFSTSGAKQMVYAEKMFDKLPVPDVFFGLHVVGFPFPRGSLILHSGPTMASSDNLRIVVKGVSTHGSQPWTGKDAIVTSAQIVNNLQTIISRELNIQEQGVAVISIGTINGGIRQNCIAGECVMNGSIRTLTTEARGLVLRRIKEIAESTALMNGCTAKVSFIGGIPPVGNDPTVASNSIPVLKDVVGLNVISNFPPVSGSDDVSVFMGCAPGIYAFLPAGVDPEVMVMNHMANFDVHEPSLITGARFLGHTAAHFMEFPYKSATFKSNYQENCDSYSINNELGTD